MNVIEALARYAEDGHRLRFISDADDGKLRVAFTIDDSELFDGIVGELSSTLDFSRDGGRPGSAGG